MSPKLSLQTMRALFHSSKWHPLTTPATTRTGLSFTAPGRRPLTTAWSPAAGGAQPHAWHLDQYLCAVPSQPWGLFLSSMAVMAIPRDKSSSLFCHRTASQSLCCAHASSRTYSVSPAATCMRCARSAHTLDTHAVHAACQADFFSRFSLFRRLLLVQQAPIAHEVSLMSEGRSGQVRVGSQATQSRLRERAANFSVKQPLGLSIIERLINFSLDAFARLGNCINMARGRGCWQMGTCSHPLGPECSLTCSAAPSQVEAHFGAIFARL